MVSYSSHEAHKESTKNTKELLEKGIHLIKDHSNNYFNIFYFLRS
jgi:hypothetical protein